MRFFAKKLMFPLFMASFMVYGMETYNTCLRAKNISISSFFFPFQEFLLLVVIVIILQNLIGGPIAELLAINIQRSENQKMYINFTKPLCTVLIMCPLMSFVATLLFKDYYGHLVLTWTNTIKYNIPMAIVWQIIFVGPFLRGIFKLHT